MALASVAVWFPRPLSPLEDGSVRVELAVAAGVPRNLRPVVRALRQRTAVARQAFAVGSVWRAVRHLVRVGRRTDHAPMGHVRRHRHLGVGCVPPRRRRRVERDPSDAPPRRARRRASEAVGRQRPPDVRHRTAIVRHDRGRATATPGLVPRRSRARCLGRRAGAPAARPGGALENGTFDVDSHVYEPAAI